MNISMEKLVGFAKEKGYIFAGSEIYGGLSNTWDYGPLGVELKNNIKVVPIITDNFLFEKLFIKLKKNLKFAHYIKQNLCQLQV